MAYGLLDILNHMNKVFEKLTKIPEVNILLRLAKLLVYKEGNCIEEFIREKSIDWDKFVFLLAYHEFYAFAYSYFRENRYLLKVKEIEGLKNSYYYSLFYTSILWQEFMEINEVFNNTHIKCVPLKGIGLIAEGLYSDKMYLRPMCDIDLLVRKEDFNRVEKILGDLGYKKALHGLEESYWKKKNYHLAFRKVRGGNVPLSVEVHWALDYKRNKFILPRLWGRTRKRVVENKNVHLLSPEDTLFSLALHQRRFGKVFCLKNICDAALILSRYSNKFDWVYVVEEALSGGMCTTLYFLLAKVKLLLEGNVPDWVEKSLNIPKYKRRLIEKFILEKTFSLISISKNIGKHTKKEYLKNHFLLYDNFLEPIKYIFFIPQEQFAKFYRLPFYTPRTTFFYRIRYLYMLTSFLVYLWSALFNSLCRVFKYRRGL